MLERRIRAKTSQKGVEEKPILIKMRVLRSRVIGLVEEIKSLLIWTKKKRNNGKTREMTEDCI